MQIGNKMLKRLNHNGLTPFFFVFILVFLVSRAWGWDNKTTHLDMSESATNQSVLNYGYLTSNLGLQFGVDAALTWASNSTTINNSVIGWIQLGANTEDDLVPPRVVNHFHNPLSNSGLTDTLPLSSYIFIISLIESGFPWESALTWAKDPVTQGGIYYYNDDWSWQTTKLHYYNSLTASLKIWRDAELAQTFYGLGHQIHLLQDMSQPAHVRNDGHLDDFVGMYIDYKTGTRGFEKFENWAAYHYQTEALTYIYNLDGTHPLVFPDFSLTSGVSLTFDSFWDTDKYDGTSPVSRTETKIGLSEYTNSNFFSDDTINPLLPGDYLLHHFPFPSNDYTTYIACSDPQTVAGQITSTVYYGNRACNDPAGPDHFLKGSLLNIGSFQLNIPWFSLDSKVYNDYAQVLFPRAVGYSAAFINYFFRGELRLENLGSNQFRVWNFSPEPLNSGNISVYYDNTYNDRTFLGSVSISTPIATGQSSNSSTYTPPSGVSFPPTDNIEPGVYWLVFQGSMGNEANAVIGSKTGWKEEWDNGEIGNHNWYYTLADCTDTYCFIPNGTVTEVVQGGELNMSNSRPSGTPNPSPSESPDAYGEYYIGAQANEFFIGIENTANPDPALRDMFPIAFGPNTVVTFKVDTMTSSLTNSPLQGCGSYTGTLALLLNSSWPVAWQVIEFSFDNGGTPYVIDLTVPGQASPYANLLEYLTPGTPLYFNPYLDMQSVGVTIVPPLKLKSIDIWQQLYGLCSTSTTIDQQSLAVDYIRIQEKTW